ncbi:SPOR domain-containing protein [Psychroserpens ponticola]|uniref:SPOR domain-containing protein n=1 Tax=Psychroserpens ponticola TaxID=2932268 RepID=A0ABY7RYP1_9FLAO|nr:SPOR domain-containing protein [Psychroserpens ponticola]WCO02029.1 SPOR domain-containing protein [Psychroserpens ponticola]
MSFAQSGTVSIDQDSDIDKLLEFKKDVKTVNLYKIQVYSGTRSGAESSKQNFLNAFNEWPVSMEFDSPNTKIWVGNFRSRLEADKALLKIKRKYNNAFIFEPKKDKK